MKTTDSKKGYLLIAEPNLIDDSFNRTIVLVADHQEGGAIGFITNRPLPVKINDVLPEFPTFDATIFYGGPVQKDNLYFIHSLGEQLEGSVEISRGIFWGGDISSLAKLIEAGQVAPNEVRFFMGYSGWESEQLEDEIKEKSWLVVNNLPNLDLMKDEPDELWRKALLQMDDDYKLWANAPSNPLYN